MNTTSFDKNSPLILLVDDDRATRMMLRRAIEQEGYQVAEASDGAQGLEVYSRLHPDMVLLDARMPVMDGFTCCTQLQAIAGGRRTPVLMITSLEDEDSVERAFQAGATDYITKPIHWAVLRRRVQRMLQERQAEAEILRALEREKELSELRYRIVTMVSHEYRTPLTAILSSAELLECYWPKWDEEKRNKHLERIQFAAHHLTQLVADVLSLNQVESGQLQFKPAPVDLEVLCRDLVKEKQLKASANITFNCQGECNNAVLDAKLIGEILSNVLSNAIKYSPERSNIRFDLTICERSAVIGQFSGATLLSSLDRAGESNKKLTPEKVIIFRIQDEGIGIVPEDLSQIFNAFHRASNVGNIPGTGLGLAIAKKCVELHGGQIEVESEMGVGTTVTVTLPIKTAL